MPSKSEIKKNPKESKIGISKNTKAAPTKKLAKVVRSKAVKKEEIKTSTKSKSVEGAKKVPSKKRVTSLKDKSTTSNFVAPTIEQITARAHQLWLEEGCPEGRADIHWQLAESELAR